MNEQWINDYWNDYHWNEEEELKKTYVDEYVAFRVRERKLREAEAKLAEYYKQKGK